VTANDKDKTLRIWDLERGEIDISMSKNKGIISFIIKKKFMEMIFIVVNGILIMD